MTQVLSPRLRAVTVHVPVGGESFCIKCCREDLEVLEVELVNKLFTFKYMLLALFLSYQLFPL
jgi:hypothetical protein